MVLPHFKPGTPFDPLFSLSNGFAGYADQWGGLSRLYRQALGYDDVVQKQSTAYMLGGLAADAHMAIMFAASLRGGRGSLERYKKLEAQAQKDYPKLAGKQHKHHVDPLYMGGPKNGRTVPMDAAYHQYITNFFRQLHAFGSGVVAQKLRQMYMRMVYRKYPLPPPGS